MISRVSSRNLFRNFRFFALILAAFMLISGNSSALHAEDAAISYTLQDAKEQSVLKDESTHAILTPTYDETSQKDVLEFDYTIPQGSKTSIRSANFPLGFTADSINALKISCKVLEQTQIQEIKIQAVLKGSLNDQIIDLPLKRAGWNEAQASIDWSSVGTLNEVLIEISPAPEKASAKGTLQFAADFSFKQSTPAEAAPITEEIKTDSVVNAVTEKTAPVIKTVIEPVKVPAAKASYNLMDSGEQGATPTGEAKGSLTPTYDESSGKDVFELDYNLTPGSELRAWLKKFPVTITPDSINSLRGGLRIGSTQQAAAVNLKVELKGSLGAQTIPVQLKTAWNAFQSSIDWNSIGSLDEIALILTPTSGATKGTFSFSADLVKSTILPRDNAGTQTLAPFSFMDSEEKGVFNIGDSQGTVSVEFDEALGKDIWKFDYTVPQGSVVGVWSKSFPAELTSASADAARIGVKVPNASQLAQTAVKVEIKGSRGTQSLPLPLHEGWNSIREFIQWSAIGDLQEFVFVVAPMKTRDTEPPHGTLYFEFDFGKCGNLEKFAPWFKTGLVLVLGLILTLASSILRKMAGQNKSQPTHPKSVSGVKQDILFALMTILIGVVALRIYALGAISILDAGFSTSFLIVGLAGVLIAEILKRGLAGQGLSPSEVFQNLLIVGLLAAGSTRQEILQAPATWGQLLTVSPLSAAVAFLIYQIFNVLSLRSSGKHLKVAPSVAIVGTPFLFGWLLLLENAVMLQGLGKVLSLTLASAWPAVTEMLGRFLVMLVFNEAITNGMGILTKGQALKTWKAHGTLALVSLAVVLAPWVAHLGSLPALGSLPIFLRALASILATALSFGGLWGEVYLITGILLDGGHNTAPSAEGLAKHAKTGIGKGTTYSGILMAILYALAMILSIPAAQAGMKSIPLLVGTFAGVLFFPFIKTIIETFDGSLPFFERTAYSYRDKTLYARGAVVGFGLAYLLSQGLYHAAMAPRIQFGLLIGFLASGGVSFIRDLIYSFQGRGRIQSWRLYLVDSLLGTFVGAALAFYLDASQIPVVVEKFKLYTSAGFDALNYTTYPLLNKWGKIDLGMYSGGSKLIFLESLAGVINWAIAAWLFAINKVFIQSFFEKDTTPIKFFFSKAGFATLMEHMIYVLRWGLWMSPIIFTFLRMMPDPTWYNQDGAIRTLMAIWHKVTMSPDGFREWSLQLFITMMAFDLVRILIWMDHMGLRVATLVNLSFIGMDRLDEKMARFIGKAAAQRYIPEGVKRFTTWAPLLIPFYIPRGEEWEYAWSTAESVQNANRGKGLLASVQSLSSQEAIVTLVSAFFILMGISWIIRKLQARSRKRQIMTHELTNREYRTTVRENGEIFSEVIGKDCDVTRRSYDIIDPCGRILFLAESSVHGKTLYWPVAGNFSKDRFESVKVEKGDGTILISNTAHGVRTQIEIRLPDLDTPAEIWSISVENLTDKPRQLKIVPYLEWVLNGWIHDRFHTQYARLYPEMEYASSANAILTWQKSTKSMGYLATDLAPEGFLTSRVDFIGRARSITTPRIFDAMDFLPPQDTTPSPSFDPIGSLVVPLSVGPHGSKSVRMMIGYAKKREAAITSIQKHLKPVTKPSAASPKEKKQPFIGHGEIPAGTPQPYSEFIDHGNKLLVKTPFTTRPYDHAMSNPLHSVMVTNRGLHTSCNGNSQQNRLTPDWADTVTREIPGEAIYLYDIDHKEWFSPTYHPLNDRTAKHECEFAVDGTALFRMSQGTLSTELTVFVPPKDPTGVYLLTIRNHSKEKRRMRVAPFFHIVLSFQPERSGPLGIHRDKALSALFFENPRNIFRSGPAFASLSIPAEHMETRRGRFIGEGRSMTHPFLVSEGHPDETQLTDDRQVAAFLGTVEIPAGGETTVTMILGQTETRKEALQIVQKYKNLETVRKSLEETRRWWMGFMNTAAIESNHPEFDRLQNWLKYQALAERIWARRGFYQTSGAYGFRDQLQDTVNLMWVDPALARKQIILHASQQFIEGDVFHWFFTLPDGRTAFSCRSQASDNPVWLPWAVAEYLKATDDQSLLDERASYVLSEFPYPPLPKNKHGIGHLYHRATRSDSIYKHCMRSIDLILEKRSGKNGLPLIQTGDWNDGLDEIGSEGKGESVWLGFFLHTILKNFLDVIEKRDGAERKAYYQKRLDLLAQALEKTWRDDRYLRAFHDDGTEIGLKGSGIWEIDALTAAWAVMAGINFERGHAVFHTALQVLEKENAILLGWPALREDTKPYLGRSSKYPEGVRENGMYCHGVQWMVKAARILAEEFEKKGNEAKAAEHRAIAYRLWLKISPVAHMTTKEIEIYGGQPNKQAADLLTNFDPGRMIWHGYTGAAGWMLRQAFEGVAGAALVKNELVQPADLDKPRGDLKIREIRRNTAGSPLTPGSASKEKPKQPDHEPVFA